MGSPAERYVLRGGKAGYDRLLILARDRWPDTRALLLRAGVATGMDCLDIGCGSGEVTMELAGLVGPTGKATGIDMDEVKLDLAQKAANDRHIANVRFRKVNATEWRERDEYDLVYTRFLLQHLRDPAELIRRMWEAVRKGGVLVVEEADFEGWCCDPPNPSFDFFVRTYNATLRHHGGDPTAGRRLFRYFRETGIPGAHLSLVQPSRHDGEAKSLPWSTLDASSQAVLDAGVATLPELQAALGGLAEFLESPESITAGPRIFQVWARR